MRTDLYEVAYEVHADGAFEETRRHTRTILDTALIRAASRTTIEFSTAVESADVLEAYVEKSDGTRIEVPLSDFEFETRPDSSDRSASAPERAALSVRFPDLAIGDTTVLAYRIVAIEPMYPGHFSVTESFARQESADEVDVRMSLPSTLAVQVDAHDLELTRELEEDGRLLLQWHHRRARSGSAETGATVDGTRAEPPGLSLSTFQSYADIARAYGERARPKAAPTGRIRNLAEGIAGSSRSPREAAQSLYDWVSTNIRPTGRCLGPGAVVPRDLDRVLDSHSGDCKDHATLLQALLAAKGIASTQALVSTRTNAPLPYVPLASAVDHVINYIPALDLFADATARGTPFGSLPAEDADRPALLVDGFREGVRTPARPVISDRRTMTVGIDAGIRD